MQCTEFRRSLVVKWKVKTAKKTARGVGGQRGAIAGLSAKSARRLIFALLNSPKDWGVMATLTFRERVTDGHEVMKKFLRRQRASGLSGAHFGWVREYQERGAVHYHYLLEREFLRDGGLLEPDCMRIVRRGKADRKVVGGKLERMIVENWTKAVVDTSQEFMRFQDGGIVEVLEAGESAASYFGSYLGKGAQKMVPEGTNVSGRWWFICPEAKPVPVRKIALPVWPFHKPFSVVFDKLKIVHDTGHEDAILKLPKRPPHGHSAVDVNNKKRAI